MHICWRSLTQSGYTQWQRIPYSDGTDLKISLTNITADRRLLPRISEFSHSYLGGVSPDEEVWFQISTDGITMEYFILINNYSSVSANSNIYITQDNFETNGKL